MIDALKPYPEYKDSGVEWLGQVPAHWEVRRLKSSVNNVVDQTTERQSNDLYVALEHIESWTGRLRTVEDNVAFESQVKRFRAGDVLFGKLRPYLAKVTRPDVDGVCVGELLVLRPRGQSPSAGYLEKLLRSAPVIDAVNSSTFGAKMPRADWGFIGGMRITIPPLPEQTAIVRFLDYVDRRVRRVIRARQRLVELLEEYKQALIHQAVTGRIDVRTGQPYPEYKDSGVEWLGEVPAHWEVRRNAQLFLQRNDTGFTQLPILEVSLRTGVQVRDLADGARKQVLSDREGYKRVHRGEIAYNMMRMWQGAVGIAPVDGLVSPAYVVAAPRSQVNARYYVRLFTISEYKLEIDRCSRGIVKDRNRLYWEDFKGMSSPYPPLAEQTAIVEYLDAQTAKIDRAADAARREIDLLKEFRTRLIADVVTGKLDVREAAARLPEETEEPGPLDALEVDAETKEAADDLDDTPVEAEA